MCVGGLVVYNNNIIDIYYILLTITISATKSGFHKIHFTCHFSLFIAYYIAKVFFPSVCFH
jgi:hypothetical protein